MNEWLLPCAIRINRYIVGCKFKLEKGNKATDWELIDTQWDVNAIIGTHGATGQTELIDTQWDVNVFRNVMEYGGYIELIDTQWDVNYP